jgi:hypothetical protein
MTFFLMTGLISASCGGSVSDDLFSANGGTNAGGTNAGGTNAGGTSTRAPTA